MNERDFILSRMSPRELEDAQSVGIRLDVAQRARLSDHRRLHRELAPLANHPVTYSELVRKRNNQRRAS